MGQGMEKHRKGFYEKVVKRILDFLIGLIGLILLSPVLLITAILVRVKLGSPVLFKQKRPGYQEKIFTLYKFRTMTDARDEKGELLPDEVRLTSFGKKLRSTSLDELPELLNLVNGSLSLIGPRPLLVQYLPLYNERQKRRHDVRPGLTGYAQVHGRNAITWEDKFEKDVYYVEHISFLLDMKIFFQTIKTVFRRDGINGEDSVTMAVFTGTKEAEDEKA